jgi:hypothetical protein
MPQSRQLAAIMPVRPKYNEGGFTDIINYVLNCTHVK